MPQPLPTGLDDADLPDRIREAGDGPDRGRPQPRPAGGDPAAQAPEEVRGTARGALLVLGMHRAGTSLLASVLGLAGAAMPRTLIGPGEHTGQGYGESRPIRAFNDRLLAAAGSAWDDWLPLPEAWFATLDAAGFREEGRALLGAEFGDAPLIALKDPRACRLAPFWTGVLADRGDPPMAVLTLRDPAEVAASLEARDGLPPEQGHLLWLRHALDAERATRGLGRAFTSHEALLGDWRGEARRIGAGLGLDWPRPPASIPEAEAPVRRELRHQGAGPARNEGQPLPPLPPLPPAPVREAFAVLARWARDGEDEGGRARLDALAAELDAAGRIAGPAVARSRRDGLALAADRARAQRGTEEAAALTARVARSEARSQAHLGAAEEARRQLGEAQARLTELDAQAGLVAELRRVLDAAMADLRAAARRTDALSAALREREAELAARTAEVAQMTTLLLVAEAGGLRPRERLREMRDAAAPLAARLGGAGARLGAGLGARLGVGRGGEASPREVRRRMEEVRRTGEFDAEWYLRANLDVALAGLDPLRHYVTHGRAEGRAPNGRPALPPAPVPGQDGTAG